MTDFVKNEVTVDLPRVLTNDYPKGEWSAKSFTVISYSDEFSATYIVDGEEYNDEGTGNDLLANDGIYTSFGLYSAPQEAFDYEHLTFHGSPEFAHGALLDQEFSTQTLGKKRPKLAKGLGGYILGAAIDYLSGCSYSYTYIGSSSAGTPCSWGGCLVIKC